MSTSNNSTEDKQPSVFTQPWATTWRKTLVSLPRLVPDITLRMTSPEGPQPIVSKLPSRGKHKVPVYVFIPPSITTTVPDPKGSDHPISCPVLLDFHGGSFVMGSCQEQAPFCALLCRELNCIAISVDYRLGPAAQFPAALEDAEDVVHAVLDPSKPGYNTLRHAINTAIPRPTDPNTPRPRISLDTTRLALSGFSSGGNLACNLVLSVDATPPLLPSRWPSPIPPDHHSPIPTLLFYPSLDARLLPHERPLPTGLDPPKGFFASLDLEKELMPTYLPRHLATHPRASPGLAPLLRPLPSATTNTPTTSTIPKQDQEQEQQEEAIHPAAKLLMVLPELDALTSPSRAWAARVRAETAHRATDVEVLDVPRMLHGWTQFPDGWLDDASKKAKRDVFERALAFVRKHWAA